MGPVAPAPTSQRVWQLQPRRGTPGSNSRRSPLPRRGPGDSGWGPSSQTRADCGLTSTHLRVTGPRCAGELPTQLLPRPLPAAPGSRGRAWGGGDPGVQPLGDGLIGQGPHGGASGSRARRRCRRQQLRPLTGQLPVPQVRSQGCCCRDVRGRTCRSPPQFLPRSSGCSGRTVPATGGSLILLGTPGAPGLGRPQRDQAGTTSWASSPTPALQERAGPGLSKQTVPQGGAPTNPSTSGRGEHHVPASVGVTRPDLALCPPRPQQTQAAPPALSVLPAGDPTWGSGCGHPVCSWKDGTEAGTGVPLLGLRGAACRPELTGDTPLGAGVTGDPVLDATVL